jgi:hypothetical protein
MAMKRMRSRGKKKRKIDGGFFFLLHRSRAGQDKKDENHRRLSPQKPVVRMRLN